MKASLRCKCSLYVFVSVDKVWPNQTPKSTKRVIYVVGHDSRKEYTRNLFCISTLRAINLFLHFFQNFDNNVFKWCLDMMKGATVMILIWMTMLLMIIILFLKTCFKSMVHKKHSRQQRYILHLHNNNTEIILKKRRRPKAMAFSVTTNQKFISACS